MAGVDWLAIGVAALSVAAVGLALWLASDRDWREALLDPELLEPFEHPFGDVASLNEELAADRESSRGGGGSDAADRRDRPFRTHGGGASKS